MADPAPSLPISGRAWVDVQRLTDATGKRRITTIREHMAEGVRLGVLVLPEAKGSVLMERPEFWQRLGVDCDAVGHPRVMMTLSNIGSPVKRLAAAKAGRSMTDAIYVGDGEWDLRACRELGIPFIGTGNKMQRLLDAGAEHICEDLEVELFGDLLRQIGGNALLRS